MGTALENYHQVKLAGPVKRLLGRGLERGVRNLTPHKSQASILAHEYGHAKTLMGTSKPARDLRMLGYGFGSYPTALYGVTRLGKVKPSKLKALSDVEAAALLRRESLRLGAIQAAGEAPRLAEEFLASYHGLKTLKKFKGISTKGYKRARRDLGLAYSTYLAGAVGNVATMAAAPYVVSGKLPMGALLGTKGLPFLAGQGSVALLSESLKSTPTLGALGRGRLARAMGQRGVPNLQTRYGRRSGLGAFFMTPRRLSKAQEKAFSEVFGKRGTRRAMRKGAVSAPKMTPGELGHGEGYQDKLLHIARRLQE